MSDYSDFVVTKRTILILVILFSTLIATAYYWSTIDRPLLGEGVIENLSKAFNALLEDPGYILRSGRLPFFLLGASLVGLAVIVKTLAFILRKAGRPLDISPFGTTKWFVLFTIAVFLLTMALEAGATKYGWYCYFCLNEPYKTLFTGTVPSGVDLFRGGLPPYWGGAPFDNFTHTLAFVSVGSILLNFRLDYYLKVKHHWVGIIVLAIVAICGIMYEIEARQPSVEYWNAVLDIWHDISGGAISVVAWFYLVPVEAWEQH